MPWKAATEFSGPFFEVNPGETFFANMKRTMQGVADQGAAMVRGRYMANADSRALVQMTGDRVADHVIGRVFARPSKGGRQWVAAAVVQVYNEGMTGAVTRSLYAAASIVESRTFAIRDLTGFVTNGSVLTTANLTAGLE